jgi:hypothetical protein
MRAAYLDSSPRRPHPSRPPHRSLSSLRQHTPAPNGKIDFDAKLRENPSPNEMNWSGYAAELIKACNSGNVLVLKSRRSGFTRLMTEYLRPPDEGSTARPFSG